MGVHIKNIDAFPSSYQFRNSIPIVALPGKYEQSRIDEIANQYDSLLDYTASVDAQMEDLDNLSDDILLLEEDFDWSD